MSNEIYENLNNEKHEATVEDRIKFFARYISSWIEFEPHIKNSICELGSGNCFLTDELRSMGFSVTPYDYYPSRDEVMKCDLNNSLNNQNKNTYDLVFSSHTLEHLDNMVNLFTIIKDQYMSSGGSLIFAVPNSEYPSDNCFNPYDSTIGHMIYYTPDIIRGLCKHFNFHPVDISEVSLSPSHREIFAILKRLD